VATSTQSYPVNVPAAPAMASVDATVLESIDESLLHVLSPKVWIHELKTQGSGSVTHLHLVKCTALRCAL
jgi:hypothetical protein